MFIHWEEAGIPPGYSFEKLLYNPQTSILVAQLCLKRTNVHKRLFWRQKDESNYQPVGNPAEDVSQESPIVSLGTPILLFNTHKLTEREDGLISRDWDGVYLFNLEKLALEQFLIPETASWPPPYRSGWVADLLGLSQDAGTVFLRVGLEGPNGSTMHYFLAQLTSATKHIELLAPLRSGFL